MKTLIFSIIGAVMLPAVALLLDRNLLPIGVSLLGLGASLFFFWAAFIANLVGIVRGKYRLWHAALLAAQGASGLLLFSFFVSLTS